MMFNSDQWIAKIHCENWEGEGRFYMDEAGNVRQDRSVKCSDQARTAFFDLLESRGTVLFEEFQDSPQDFTDASDPEPEFCIWLERMYKERYS